MTVTITLEADNDHAEATAAILEQIAKRIRDYKSIASGSIVNDQGQRIGEIRTKGW